MFRGSGRERKMQMHKTCSTRREGRSMAEHGGAADGSGLRDSLTEDEDRSTWSL